MDFSGFSGFQWISLDSLDFSGFQWMQWILLEYWLQSEPVVTNLDERRSHWRVNTGHLCTRQSNET